MIITIPVIVLQQIILILEEIRLGVIPTITIQRLVAVGLYLEIPIQTTLPPVATIVILVPILLLVAALTAAHQEVTVLLAVLVLQVAVLLPEVLAAQAQVALLQEVVADVDR